MYSSHSIGSKYFFLLLHSLQTTATLFLVVCKECNNKKKYLLPMEWEEYISGFTGSDEDELG